MNNKLIQCTKCEEASTFTQRYQMVGDCSAPVEIVDGEPAIDYDNGYGGGVHVKLYGRGERCEVPDGAEYLMVVAYGLDSNGNWLPSRVSTAKSYPELKDKLRDIAAAAGGVVVQGSSQFGRLAKELGLPLLTAEWGKL